MAERWLFSIAWKGSWRVADTPDLRELMTPELCLVTWA